MRTVLLALALLLAALLLTGCDAARPELKHTTTTIPRGWRRSHSASLSRWHTVTLALPQRNLGRLSRLFHQVSDPRHRDYQRHLTKSEIDAIIAPVPSLVAPVLDWLASHNVTGDSVRHYGDAVQFTASVDTVNALFHTALTHWTHSDGSEHIASDGTHAIPSHIDELIEFHTGVTNFPLPHRYTVTSGDNHRHDRKLLQSTNMYATMVPRDFANIYGSDDRSQSMQSSLTSIAVATFTGSDVPQSFNAQDIQLQGSLVNVPNIQTSPVLYNNTNTNPNNPQNEPSLDIQTITAFNPSATAWFWEQDDSGWIYEFAINLQYQSNPPQVISISYSTSENGASSGDYQAYMARSDVELLKIGLMGITVLASSGDNGASGADNSFCTYSGVLSSYLYVEWPASSPYVTSIGATAFRNFEYSTDEPNIPLCGLHSGSLPTGVTPSSQLKQPWQMVCITGTGCDSDSEVSADLTTATFTSGGGFSRVYARPSWQDAAVSGYLSRNGSGVTFPPRYMFNSSNRAVPDISIFGAGIGILVNGALGVQGGTSLSAPLMAVIVSLLNEVSLQYSGKTLGFLNPLLYQMFAEYPQAFNDITVGNNAGTRFHAANGCEGYQAAIGYDAVTGLGSPKFRWMKAYLVAKLTNTAIVDPVDSGTCNTSNSLSLSTGSLIGIIVASVIGGLALIGIVALLVYCCATSKEPLPSPQPRDFGDSWACLACSMINRGDRMTCRACITRKGQTKRNGVADAVAAGESWPCAACTVVNSGDRATCKTCGTQRASAKPEMNGAAPIELQSVAVVPQ